MPLTRFPPAAWAARRVSHDLPAPTGGSLPPDDATAAPPNRCQPEAGTHPQCTGRRSNRHDTRLAAPPDRGRDPSRSSRHAPGLDLPLPN